PFVVLHSANHANLVFQGSVDDRSSSDSDQLSRQSGNDNSPSRSRRLPWHALHPLHALRACIFHVPHALLHPHPHALLARHVGHAQVGCKVSADNSHDQGSDDTPDQKRPALCLAGDLHFVPPLSLPSSRPTARSSSARRCSNVVSDR